MMIRSTGNIKYFMILRITADKADAIKLEGTYFQVMSKTK